MSPAPGRDAALRASIRGLAEDISMSAGLAGLHLLRHETPRIAATEEQKIRGNADRTADWVLVACGYAPDALRALGRGELSGESLVGRGAAPGAEHGLYALSCSATPGDVADVAVPADDPSASLTHA